MNELITSKKMTSMEISEVTRKQHQHIMRDIRDEIEKLENAGISTASKFGLRERNGITGPIPFYELTKEGVLQLAARYDAVVRAKLIERVLQPYPKVPVTYPPYPSQYDSPETAFHSWSPVNLRGGTYERIRTEAEQLNKTINSIAEKYIRAGMDVAAIIADEVKKQRLSNGQKSQANKICPVKPFDWKSDVNQKIEETATNTGMAIVSVRGILYRTLEIESNCNLAARVVNLKARMKKSGATYKEQKTVTKLDVISNDKRLKQAFEEIVRREFP